MATTTCVHQEIIEHAGRGVDQGTCKTCGQVRQYNTVKPHEAPVVVKLGRIHGKVVLPRENDKVNLSSGEAAELKAARAETGVATNEPLPSTWKPRESNLKWYRSHKKEMIEDLISLGVPGFLEKWKVKRQIISHLKSDELYKSKVVPAERLGEKQAEGPPAVKGSLKPKRKRPGTAEIDGPGKKAEGNHLPLFPDWSPEKWTGEIMVQWLKTYEALRELELIRELAARGPAYSRVKEAKRILSEAERKPRGNWQARLFRRWRLLSRGRL